MNVHRDHADRIKNALDVAMQYGTIDGGHHKMWVIDQMVRILAADKYEQMFGDPEGDEEYNWDLGIAP